MRIDVAEPLGAEREARRGLRRQRREPQLAGRSGVEGDDVGRERGLVDEADARPLRVRDPDEVLAVDHREADELARGAGERVEVRLARVRDAGREVEALADDGEAHGQPVEARHRVLLDPAEVHQRAEEAVDAALGHGKPVRDFAKRHLPRAFGEELDDREAALSGNV